MIYLYIYGTWDRRKTWLPHTDSEVDELLKIRIYCGQAAGFVGLVCPEKTPAVARPLHGPRHEFFEKRSRDAKKTIFTQQLGGVQGGNPGVEIKHSFKYFISLFFSRKKKRKEILTLITGWDVGCTFVIPFSVFFEVCFLGVAVVVKNGDDRGEALRVHVLVQERQQHARLDAAFACC